MRRSLQFFSLLLLALGLSFAHPARATHGLGGTLTYTSLGNNQYRVRCDLYRDCSGNNIPASLSLKCVSGGTCQIAAVTAVMLPSGPPLYGNPYSSSIQPPPGCSNSTTYANFEARSYQATVTLPPNSWQLSIEVDARPLLANVWNSNWQNLRIESTLNNTTSTNNSAQFSALPVFFVPHQQDNLLHIGAFDMDGDSLSYQLVPAQSGCNQIVQYLPSAMPCANSVRLGCALTCVTPTMGAGLYTYNMPLAVKLDTLGTCPNKTIAPRFAFDSLSGALAFHPNRYLSTAPVQGDNKYLVVVKVTEWRKVNGSYVVVGTVRRDMVWIVYDGTNADLPRVAPTVTVQSNGTTTQARTSLIPVRAGSYANVQFTATNRLPANVMTYTLEQNTLPGVTVQNGPAPGQATLRFIPPASLPDGVYSASLSVTDDAAPLRNLTTVPVSFLVYRGTLASKAGKAAAALAAYPNPFSERVQFQLASPGVQLLMVYNQLGQVVAHLQSRADGQVQWQPGAELPAGLYLARTQDGSQSVRLLRTEAE